MLAKQQNHEFYRGRAVKYVEFCTSLAIIREMLRVRSITFGGSNGTICWRLRLPNVLEIAFKARRIRPSCSIACNGSHVALSQHLVSSAACFLWRMAEPQVYCRAITSVTVTNAIALYISVSFTRSSAIAEGPRDGLHLNYKAHMACDLSVIVNNERVLKVTGSHVHFKSGSI